MRKRVGIGYQDFEEIRMNNVFYIDKTAFVREWWEEDGEFKASLSYIASSKGWGW